MKKTILFILIAIGIGTAKAQETLQTVTDRGNSTTNPLGISRAYDAVNNKALKMFYQGSWGQAYYATDFRFLDIASTEGGKILQLNGYGMGIGVDPPSYDSQDKLYVNGNVGIGTTTPREKLSVNGNIRAKEVKVETANWPDYVFEKSYKLTSLTDLESYIKTNGHLPGMATAHTVEKEGIAVSETIKGQQQIIEELTLHLIEKDKEIKKLQINNSIQENKHVEDHTILQNLLKRLEILEKKL